ncbi:amidohydrolase family protein [Streptomyces sp. NPDC014734]|uniref:metal-dependent hydrolase family protein n=1 Tax=Streptomyces sp. NPDC014734 TaxID=3364886 RepID=UPI0036FD94F5
MTPLLITNATVLDARRGTVTPRLSVLVRGGLIEEITDSVACPPHTEVINARGRVLMPGLIDSHVHATQFSGDFTEITAASPYYRAARTAQVLHQMLLRGFTTVRDLGGADHGVARAVEEGLFPGPRVLFGGPIIAPTGGHALTRICDGETELRRAIREQTAVGAHHVKLTLSGGVISSMKIDSLAYSVAEISAAVDEAALAGRYVAGHAYTAAAVNRALECGVRTIEHGNLIDESSIDLFRQHDAYYVPTLATYFALAASDGLSKDARRKVQEVTEAGLQALALADKAGIRIAYGTDLHGRHHDQQLTEFTLRAKVQQPADIVRAATVAGAELCGLTGKVGEIVPGARADLLLVDGNPLEDVGVLADPSRHLKLILQGGAVVHRDI